MYERYWQLDRPAFESDFDPEFYFPARSHQGALLKLRFALDHHVNLRPGRLYPGVSSPISGVGEIDFVVVREGTEGPYTGNGGALRIGTPHEVATEVSVNTAFGVQRVVRDAFTHELARQLLPWSPRTRFVEVVLNGNYQGIYLVAEKIKRGKDRVDIAKLDELDVAGDELTGGYIIKMDKTTGTQIDGWVSPYPAQAGSWQSTYYQYHYPKPEDIQPAQKQYIQNWVTTFENLMASPNYADTVNGYSKYLDVESFIDFVLINELTKNVDGYRLSTYFHKQRDDKGGKLRMGPTWDFDLAWFNADYCSNWLTSGWAYDINYVCPDAGVPFWWERLMQDTLYRQNTACRWQSLRGAALHTDSIFSAIDSMAAVLAEAQERNFDYWPILGVYVWPNPGNLPDTYAGEVQKMKDWIAERLDWLDFAFGQNLPGLNAAFSAASASAFDWQFAPTVAGNGYSYSWDFDDGSTSAEMSPQHQFPGTGTYTVQLTVSTAFGCSSTSQQIIHIVNAGAGDVATETLRVFPNPAGERLTVTLPGQHSEKCSIRLADALGRNVREYQFQGTQNQLVLDIHDLPAGVYNMTMQDAARQLVARIVVQH